MPRKSATTKNKAMLLLQKLAEQQGATLDLGAMERASDAAILNPEEGRGRPEGETILRSLHRPHAFMMKKCKRKDCGALFQTNFCGTNYCSDACLAADMHDLGFNYDPYRLRRWESSMYNSVTGMKYTYEPPEILPEATLDVLAYWAEHFLADYHRLKGQAQERELQQSQQMLEDSVHNSQVTTEFFVESAGNEPLEFPEQVPKSPDITWDLPDDEILASFDL